MAETQSSRKGKLRMKRLPRGFHYRSDSGFPASERTTMATPQTQHVPGISLEQVLSLVGTIINPLVPVIPIPPPERWDRLVRMALGRVFGPQPDPWLVAGPSPLASLDRVELNPQPLPPRFLFLKALAQEVITHAGLLQELTSAMATDGEERGIIIIGGYVSRFADEFCGNGFKLGWGHPGPPPQWFPTEMTGGDLIVLGSQFTLGARESFNPNLRTVLAGAASKLAQTGAARTQG
jgi:hypothetical protein